MNIDMATEAALEVLRTSDERSVYECCEMCGTQIDNKVGCHYTCPCGYQTGCGD